MDDGNVKHDLEQASRSVSTISMKSSMIGLNLLKKILAKVIRFGMKRFSTSMKALQKDGQTKEIVTTPPLTRDEMKDIIAKAKDADILVGVKEMTPEGDYSHRQSIHTQEKIAKHEIKANKYKNLSRTFGKIRFISKPLDRLSQRQNKLAVKDTLSNADKHYIIFMNKSKVGFMNDCLSNVHEQRITRMKENNLEDINKDGIINEKDLDILKTRSLSMCVKDLNEVNCDYGDCMISEYKKDYCTQKVSKAEYCNMREALFDLRSHGARTLQDESVLIAISKEDLTEYMKYAPVTSPIKEYGANGGIAIQTVKNNENLQFLNVKTEDEWMQVKEKYKGCDYIASHEKDGSITFLVLEENTRKLYNEVQKKTVTTESLLEEANKVLDNEKLQSLSNKVIEPLQEKAADLMDKEMVI